MPQPRVLIIGAGRLGQAFAHLLKQARQAQVDLWDHDPRVVPGAVPLAVAAGRADIVIFAVPTGAIRSVLSDLAGRTPVAATYIFVSKGLEPATGLTAAEIAIQILLPTQPWVVLGGPMVAEEIRSGARGHGVLAGPGVAIRTTLESILPPESMSFSTSTEPVGVSLAGVLKNIYALAYGVGVGLGWSPLALADLWKRCESEMVLAADRCGIDREVIIGPAGMDDFHTTGGSPHSRNRQAGVELATHQTLDHGAEGVSTLPALLRRFPELNKLDCFRALALLFEHQPAQRVFLPLTKQTHS